MISILIVDDQNLVQQGIKSLLDRDLDFKVIGTVKDGRNAVQQIAKIHPDIVLLDIEMPGMNGITTTKYINRVSPKTGVIILSSHEEKKYVTQALMAGAKGYLLKSSLMTDLRQAILAVNNGYSQIDSRLLAKVFDPKNIKVKKNQLNRKNTVIKQENSHQDLSESLSQPEPDSHKSEIENHQTPPQVAQSFQQEDSHQDLSESLSQPEPDSHKSETENHQTPPQVAQSFQQEDSHQDLSESLSQPEPDSHKSETENHQTPPQVAQSFQQEDSHQDLSESLSQPEPDSHKSETENHQTPPQVAQSFQQEDSHQDLSESLSQPEPDSHKSETENHQTPPQVAQSLENGSLTPPQIVTKGENSESVVKESYVVISDEKTKSVPSTVWTVKTNAYSQNQLSDSVVLKPTGQDYSPEFNQNHQETPFESGQTTLTNVSQKSTPKLYKLVNPNIKPRKRKFAVNFYYHSVLNSLKILLYRYKTGELKSRITREKTRLLSLIKQEQKRGLVINVALVILGIVVAVILGSL
jgi:DNA-binding NarL/FixJ family response regulator